MPEAKGSKVLLNLSFGSVATKWLETQGEERPQMQFKGEWRAGVKLSERELAKALESIFREGGREGRKEGGGEEEEGERENEERRGGGGGRKGERGKEGKEGKKERGKESGWREKMGKGGRNEGRRERRNNEKWGKDKKFL